MLIGFLDDARPPSAGLAALFRRNDRRCVDALLRKFHGEPSPAIRHNLRHVDHVGWLGEHALIDELEDGPQQAVVRLATTVNLKRDEIVKVLEHLALRGKPGARRAALEALRPFNGADANTVVLRALRESPCVLLVDEVDRADSEFEAFLLEVLATHQITVPELGTIRAEQPPIVVLTSNRTRELHDALKRRCLYHWIDHPSLERELAILRARAPEVVAPAAPDESDRADRLDAIRKALEGLSAQQREVFLLRHEEELPLDEIARRLGLAVGTVKSHLHRALTALRKTFPSG